MALSGGLARGAWTEEQIVEFVHAVAVAAHNEEARMRAGKAAPTAKKLENGKKTSGWPKLVELLGERGDEVVRRVRDWLGLSMPAGVADVIPEARPWPEPPAQEAFYGLAGRIVRTIEPATEADSAALLTQALVAFGNAAGRAAHFRVEADFHYANEFAILVGETAKARKGTSWGRIRQLFEEAEKEWVERRVLSGLSSAEGLIWNVRDAVIAREKIKDHGRITGMQEYEADPGEPDKRMLIQEPEFANVLRQNSARETRCQPFFGKHGNGATSAR